MNHMDLSENKPTAPRLNQFDVWSSSSPFKLTVVWYLLGVSPTSQTYPHGAREQPSRVNKWVSFPTFLMPHDVLNGETVWVAWTWSIACYASINQVFGKGHPWPWCWNVLNYQNSSSILSLGYTSGPPLARLSTITHDRDYHRRWCSMGHLVRWCSYEMLWTRWCSMVLLVYKRASDKWLEYPPSIFLHLTWILMLPATVEINTTKKKARHVPSHTGHKGSFLSLTKRPWFHPGSTVETGDPPHLGPSFPSLSLISRIEIYKYIYIRTYKNI